MPPRPNLWSLEGIIFNQIDILKKGAQTWGGKEGRMNNGQAALSSKKAVFQ